MNEVKYIKVRGARENNLKNVNVDIPKDSLVVFSGLSGSGKTTLAFDTIFAEGQRRYVESLSSYARQFLGNLEKPDVDSIEGLSPSIAIDQKGSSHNPRSTVGTVTEIYDYLRLLFARIGVPYCPIHNEPIISFAPAKMVDIILNYPLGSKIQILSPIVRQEKGTHKETIAMLKQNGFQRLRVDGQFCLIEEINELEKNKKHNIDIVIDRIVNKEDSDLRSRVFDAVELALDYSHGYLTIYSDEKEQLLSQHHTCKYCGFSIPKLEPRLFSFNSPSGCCPDCKGLGIKREADESLLIPHPELSIKEGCIEYYKWTVGTKNLEWQEFELLCNLYNIPLDKPYDEMTPRQKDIILYGSKEPIKYTLKSSSGNTNNRFQYIEGVKTKVERLYNETTSEFMREYYEKFMRDRICTTCHGARLNKEALCVKIDNKNIYDVCLLSIRQLHDWIISLNDKLDEDKKTIANLVIREVEARTDFLCEVGLDYLNLARMSMTLSGGESQRIRLATQIGSKLSGVLYVLDEPSIGLHQKDDIKLINALKKMRDLGNTLIVVEHDEETIKNADYIVDVGPKAGTHGGEIVACGTLNDIINNKNSITGQYLSGEKYIPIPLKRRKGNGKFLSIKGARCNNLKNINVDIPLGMFVTVTGVSGSGKSSLVNQTLYLYLKEILSGTKQLDVGLVKSISGVKYIDKVINVSQEPIGRTPRSNPATYTKVFDDIREVFANTSLAKAKGYDKGRFSFNVVGGRCEHCQGAGVTRIPMNFLPDVYVKCSECDGKRYNDETLQITYKGKNIYEVLEMTIEDALDFFQNTPSIKKRLQTLYDVGLGYMKLGQSATTMSGGEAQRVKLAYELQKRPTGKTLYILDEPTTGLHSDDVARLIKVLNSIVDHGDTVLVIEHNLDIIKVSDYIIDLGPDGGDNGGEVIAKGTPEEVSENKKSYTGQFLKDILINGKYK